MGTAFEQEIAAVKSLVANEATHSIEEFTRIALGSAKRLGTKPIEVAQALFSEVSAGALRAGGDFEQFNDTIIKASVAGRANAKITANVIVSAINAYSLSLNDATRVSNTLFNTLKFGITEVPKLANSLGRLIPAAAQLGIPLEEVGTALAVMTQQGSTTAQAVTRTIAILRSFTKATEATRAAARGLGFDLSPRNIRLRGLIGTMVDLQKATEGNRDALSKLFPEQRAKEGINFLATTKGVSASIETLDGFVRGVTSTQDAFNVMTNTTQFEINKATAAFAALAAEVVKSAKPSIVGFFKGLQDGIEVLSKFNKQTRIVALATTGLSITWNAFAVVFGSGAVGVISLVSLLEFAWENAGKHHDNYVWQDR